MTWQASMTTSPAMSTLAWPSSWSPTCSGFEVPLLRQETFSGYLPPLPIKIDYFAKIFPGVTHGLEADITPATQRLWLQISLNTLNVFWELQSAFSVDSLVSSVIRCFCFCSAFQMCARQFIEFFFCNCNLD